MNRVAILGGSFDPVHVGHLLLADEIAHEFACDLVLFVPAFRPAHKSLSGGASDVDRLDMLRLSLEGNPAFSVDPCEIERGGVSYMIDTVRHVTAEHSPAGKPLLVIGDDLAQGFGAWKQPNDLAAEADLVIARRLQASPPEFAWRHLLASNPLFPVSSTMVRERVAAGGAWRYLVPEAARRLIGERGLYRDASGRAFTRDAFSCTLGTEGSGT